MAVTSFPIELPPSVRQLYAAGFPYDFVLSWGNSYRSLEFVNVPQQANILPSGSFLNADGEEATAPAQIVYIACFPVDAREGPDRVTVVARDAEVNDAYLAYGTLDRFAVNTHLRQQLNIIVREAVLPAAINATFHGQGGPW